MNIFLFRAKLDLCNHADDSTLDTVDKAFFVLLIQSNRFGQICTFPVPFLKQIFCKKCGIQLNKNDR